MNQHGGPDRPRPAIADIFALESTGTDRWRSCLVDPRGGRMFGGITLGQVLVAAQRTVPAGLQLSNLTVNFHRPADGGRACDYSVERTHDGRSSAARAVTVSQDGSTLATATVSFAAAKPSRAHSAGPGDAVIAPDDLPGTGMPHPARAIPPGSFDIRYYDSHENGLFVRRLWFRALEPLGDDPTLHQCAVALISDLYFFEPAVAQHGLQANDRAIRYGTTQHSMWFHCVPAADQWLLITSTSPATAGGRGVVTGQIHTAAGDLVSTVVQEVAVRFPEVTGSGQ